MLVPKLQDCYIIYTVYVNLLFYVKFNFMKIIKFISSHGR